MSESFIHQGYISDLSLCDRLVQAYQENPYKVPGTVGTINGLTVDHAAKNSTEISLMGPLADEYFAQLQPLVDVYIQKYPQCNMYAPWRVITPPNIQHYAPGEGFFAWHTERTCATDLVNISRHLVFMTYLNDVTDGGETEFQLQALKVQPRKGLSLIWPADWTHTHRGVTSPTQEKFIVTGWFNYV